MHCKESSTVSCDVDKMAAPSRSWGDIIFEFTQNTTIHGIRYVFDRDSVSKLRRILWLMLFLVAAGFFSNQVIDRVIHYMSRPVTVKVEVNFNTTLKFPAVLLCNQNSFRITKADSLGYKPMLDEFYELEEGDPRRLDILVNHGMANMTMEKLLLDTQHRKEDMIVKCTWKGRSCGLDNFTQVMTDRGVCFAFNHNPFDKPLVLDESGANAETALTLYLNIEQYENMIGPNFAAGLKILLYDDNDIPVLKGQGQGVAAGSHTFAGTSVVVMRRLSQPYGNCTTDQKLDSYPKYSARACHTECFTKFFVNRTSCRMPYMKGKGPVCTLYQYAALHRKMQIEFDVVQEMICDCRPPCETITFKPRFTYLQASDFDIDKLLKDDIKRRLSKKLMVARDTLRATDPEFKIRDVKILNDFVNYGRKMEKLLWTDLPDLSKKQNDATKIIQKNIANIFKGIREVYDFQRFIVRKNFFRFTEYNDEMYFSEVSSSYLQFFTHFVARLRKLQALFDEGTVDLREPERRVRLEALEEILEAKLKVIELCFHALYQCVDSYNNGTMMFETPYRYQNRSWDAHLKLIPKNRLFKAIASGFNDFGNMQTRDGLYMTLFALKSFYTTLNNTALMAYMGEFKESQVADLRRRYIGLMGDFLGNRSVLMTDIFSQPLREMNSFIQDLDDIYEKVDDGFVKIYAELESINRMSSRTVKKLWPPLGRLIEQADAYRKDSSDSKMDLAAGFIDPKTRDTTQTTYEYLDDVFSQVDNIVSKWEWIHEQFMEILMKEKVMKDQDTMVYRQHFEPGWVSEESFRNTDDAREIDEVVSVSKSWSALGQKIEDTQEPFNAAFYQVVNDMKDYVDGNAIDETFYEENFISLVIYFEAMNYELIEQQASYTVYALLSDIGGSMGLFVGGSVISLFELIDVFLYNQIYKGVEDSKRRIKRKSVISTDDEKEISLQKKEGENVYNDLDSHISHGEMPRDTCV
ncbi:uncharacterized protein LOC135495376 [Lineus longissimus]|uniref:uncharacterized protein LOC135495376 n=1 Tax=Lineus longissimus TaxID=88925 RepID=UPI002B4FB5AC